jgi:hypothetical protein
MKKAVFLFLLVISLNCSAQRYWMPTQVAGITLLPDYGAGVIYGYNFRHVGVFASYSHSILDYSMQFDKAQKVTIGIKYIAYNTTTKYPFYFSLGGSYNTYEGISPGLLGNKVVSMPYDVQAGVGTMINSVGVGFRLDIFKTDVGIDLCWNFGKKVMKYKR